MVEVNLGPDPAHKETIIFLDVTFGDMHVIVTEVDQFSPVFVLIGDIFDFNLVDDHVPAALADIRLRFRGFIRSHEVVCESCIDDVQPGFNRRRIIGRTVCPEEKF